MYITYGGVLIKKESHFLNPLVAPFSSRFLSLQTNNLCIHKQGMYEIRIGEKQGKKGICLLPDLVLGCLFRSAEGGENELGEGACLETAEHSLESQVLCFCNRPLKLMA